MRITGRLLDPKPSTSIPSRAWWYVRAWICSRHCTHWSSGDHYTLLSTTLTPISERAWGRGTPAHLKKPENLSVPSEEQVFTDLRKRLNFKRTRWTSPLEEQVDYHLQTDLSWNPQLIPVFSFPLKDLVTHPWEEVWKRIPSRIPFLKTDLLLMAITVLTSELPLTCEPW